MKSDGTHPQVNYVQTTERWYGTRSEKICWIVRAGGHKVGGRKLEQLLLWHGLKKSLIPSGLCRTVGCWCWPLCFWSRWRRGNRLGGSVSIFLKPQLKVEKHPDYTPQEGYEDMFWGKIKVKGFKNNNNINKKRNAKGLIQLKPPLHCSHRLNTVGLYTY